MLPEQPKITPWKEEDVNKPEKFIVLKPCRINTEDGNGAKSYKRGDEVTVFGTAKKDLYFQNKILYPADFKTVDAYEKEQKSAFTVPPVVTKETADESQKKAIAKK